MILAHAFDAEVISCDSMQIYRGLNIGTAKVTSQDRQLVRHHLLDLLPLSAPYDVNRFMNLAQLAAADIRRRQKRVIIAGGSGMYARALVYGFTLLPAEKAVLANLEQRLAQPGGYDELLGKLEAASHPHAVPLAVQQNSRRLLRACEVLELTGQTPWQHQLRHAHADPDFCQYCLLPELVDLKERIRKRTAAMLAGGWLEEAKLARKQGLLCSPTARQALGYQDVLGYLDGKITGGLTALAEKIANRTIQYARRQLTWFKHQHPGVNFIPMTANDSPEDAAERIKKLLPCEWLEKKRTVDN